MNDDGAPAFPPEALREVDRRMRIGAAVTVAAIVTLAVGTELPFWEVVTIPVFFLLLPAFAVAQLPLLGEERMGRTEIYLGSALTILLIGLLGLGLSARLEGGWEGIGLVGLPAWELVWWTLGLTVGGIGLIALFRPLDRRFEGPHHDFLHRLLPRTGRERGAFTGLSFAAGLGEELAYRGYALGAIQLLGPGPWSAAVLSSVSFGVLHAYQGPVGIVRTGLMGMLLALPVLLTGSLLPSIIAHTLIDLVVGLLLGQRLLPGDPDDPLVPGTEGG